MFWSWIDDHSIQKTQTYWWTTGWILCHVDLRHAQTTKTPTNKTKTIQDSLGPFFFKALILFDLHIPLLFVHRLVYKIKYQLNLVVNFSIQQSSLRQEIFTNSHYYCPPPPNYEQKLCTQSAKMLFSKLPHNITKSL